MGDLVLHRLREALEAAQVLNDACDAMWNDQRRLELNDTAWGQKMRIKESHVKAITEAQQRLGAVIRDKAKEATE